MRELLQVSSLDFLLVFKGMLLHADTLQLFRDRGIRCYCLYPDVSFFDHGSNIRACLPLYDCVFTTKSFHMDDAELRSHARDLRLEPHGFDPDVNRRLPLADSTLAAYACDASFVGTWSADKGKLLRSIIAHLPAIDLRIWRPGWSVADPDVLKFWQGRGVGGDEIVAIHFASRIHLGQLSEAGTGVTSGDLTTAQTWQIPGRRGFLLPSSAPYETDRAVLKRSAAKGTRYPYDEWRFFWRSEAIYPTRPR